MRILTCVSKLCRPNKTKRVTRVVMNRRARRKEQLKTEAEAKKVGELSKDIDRYQIGSVLQLFSSFKMIVFTNFRCTIWLVLLHIVYLIYCKK